MIIEATRELQIPFPNGSLLEQEASLQAITIRFIDEKRRAQVPMALQSRFIEARIYPPILTGWQGEHQPYIYKGEGHMHTAGPFYLPTHFPLGPEAGIFEGRQMRTLDYLIYDLRELWYRSDF